MKELTSSLGIFCDEKGIYRMKGRLENSELEGVKFQNFLDRKKFVTDVIIIDCHLKVKHSKVKDTLTELRSTYWVTQGKRTVNRVIRSCTTPLPPAPLPHFRVTADFPFTSTGIDYLVPLLVKNIFLSRKRTE